MTSGRSAGRRTVGPMSDAARPADDRGRHVLHREGHVAGLRRFRMSEAEWTEFNAHPIRRSETEAGKVIDKAQRRRSTLGREHWPYLDGILLAFAWAISGEGAAPVTAQPIVGARPTWLEIAEEIDAAEDIVYGKRTDRRPQGFAVGVEATLMWLIADGDEPPV